MGGQLTEKIRQQVLADLLAGRCAPGDRLPTERETAESAGCSRITVRRAFAQLESAGIIERSPAAGTHISRTFNGSRQPVESVGVIASLEENFSVEFIEALCRTCRKRDILTILSPADDEPAKQSDLAIRLVTKGIRNLIIWGLDRRFDFSLFERLRVFGVNLVFFDRIVPGPYADYIGLDNRAAVATLFDAILRDDISELLFVGRANLEVDSVDERRTAVRALCCDAKLPLRELELPRIIGAVGARRAVGTLAPRTGIFAINDDTALQLRPFAPADCRFYSIDGTREAVEAGIVTYRQPLADMAGAALDALERQRRLGPKWRAQKIRFKGTIHPNTTQESDLCRQ